MDPRHALQPAPWRTRRSLLSFFSVCLLVVIGAPSTGQGQTPSPVPGQVTPALTAQVLPEQPRAGETFTLVVEVHWEGPNSRFVLYPPALTLSAPASTQAESLEQGTQPPTPSGSSRQRPPVKMEGTLEKRGMSQTFQSKATSTTYRYEYALVATRPGVFPLGSVRLEYRDMESRDMGPDASSFTPAPLELELPTLEVRPGGARGILGPVLAGALALGGALWLARRTRTRLDQPAPAPPPPPPPDLETLHTQARTALLEGRPDAVWATLQQARPLLSVQEDFLPPDAQLEESRLRARYGGLSATPELERLVEQLARTAAQRKKRADRAADTEGPT